MRATDHELLQRLGPDPAALREFYERHFAARRTRDPEAAPTWSPTCSSR